MYDDVKKALSAYEKRTHSYTTKDKDVSKALDLYDKRRKYNAEDELKNLSEQLVKEQEKYNSYISSPLSHGYGENAAKDILDKQRQSRINISNLRKDIEAYRDILGGKADELLSGLDTMDKGYQSVVDWANQFSQWESEDDYNRYNIGWLQDNGEISPEKAKARKDYYKANVAKAENLDKQIAEKRKEISDVGGFGTGFWETEKKDALKKKKAELAELVKKRDAVNADNRTYERTQGRKDSYYDITAQANFAADSQIRDYENPTKEELDRYDHLSDYWYSDGDHIVAYYDNDGNPINAHGDIVPDLPAAPEIKDKLGLYLSSSSKDETDAMNELMYSQGNWTTTWAKAIQEGSVHRWRLLDDTEIGIYYTLLKNNGQEAAYKFLDDMAFELTQRENRETQKLYDGSNTLEKIALSLATIPIKAIGNVIGFADDVSNLITEGEINPYSPAHRGSNFTNVIRSARAEDYNEAFGNAKIPWLGFDAGQVYQSGMSMLDSVIGGKLFGPGYSVAMGMGAASDEAQRLYEQGASTLQSTIGGFLAGAAETLFEYISLEHFLSAKKPALKKQIIKQALAQGGIEASEEVFTEVANTLTNAIVMGSQSDWQSYRDKYLKLGYTDAQATVKALFNDVAPNVINAGIGGFLSGGAMGGANSAINYGLYNVEATRTGKTISQNNNTSKLVEQAKDLPNIKNNNYLRKLADQVASNGSDSRGYYNKIGKLYDGLQNAQIDQFNNSDNQAFKELVRAELKNKGIENLDEAAEIVTKAYFGQLSSKEAKIFDSVGGKEILNTVLNSKDLDNAKTSTKISNFVNMASTNQLVSATNAESRVVDADINVDGRISDEGKTTLASTGEEVSIKEIASVKDGKMQLRLNDGTIVDSEDINYSSEEEALTYETILNLGVSSTIGNNIIKSAQKSNMPIKSFMKNVILAYDYGITNEGSRLGSIALPKNIKNFMFQTGREYAQKLSEEMLKESQSRVVKGKTSNKVTYVNKIEGKLNGKQKATIGVAEFLSNATSLDIYVFQSYRKGSKNYININGVERESSANGWFVVGTNKIYIDINAGNNFDGLGLFTLAHESGHWIRDWNATEWQKMADVIVDEIDAQAKADSSKHTFEYMLAQKYKKYEQNRKNEEALIKEGKLKKEQADYAGKSDRKLCDMAYEDVICDSLASLMSDKETFVEFANKLDKKDHKLWVKFKELIKSFLDKLDEWLKSYNGVNTEDEAGQAIQNAIKEDRDRIRELYVSAFLGANENYNKAVEKNALGGEPSNKATQKNTADEGGNKYNQREKIHPNMPDSERADIIRNTTIDVVEFKDDKAELSGKHVLKLKSTYKSEAQKILKALAEKFGVFKDYSNDSIELVFNYSRGSLNESVHKQNERNADFYDFAKMLYIFDDVIKNAQPIESHADKYRETKRENKNINQVFVLLMVSRYTSKRTSSHRSLKVLITACRFCFKSFNVSFITVFSFLQKCFDFVLSFFECFALVSWQVGTITQFG